MCVCVLGVIAAGTNLGNLAMFKYSNPDKVEEDEKCWKLQPPSSIEGSVEHVVVCCYAQVLVIWTLMMN